MKTFENYVLVEMALSRSKLIQKIVTQIPNFEDNFIKISLMGNHTAINHWKQETNAAINICKRYKIKGSNKPLNNKEIVKLIIEKSDLESAIEDIVEDYEIKNINLSLVTNKKYEDWLISVIEKGKV